MNAYYNETNITKRTVEDRLTTGACAIISVLTNKSFLKFIKLAIIALALFGFVCIVGMIDAGTLGFFSGIAICALLSLVEIITISTMVGQKE